jgi:Flp pilus assembly protein CpaB
LRTSLTGLTSRRPFTILGIFLAFLVIAAFVLVALNASQASNGQTQNVVVATRDLPPRIPIDTGALAIKSIPTTTDYPKIFFTKLDDLKGMIPLVTIVNGQAVTSNMVEKPNQSFSPQSQYLPIPSGYVALTIPTSEQQGVAFNIHPDDYISVIATVASGTKVASKTVFVNLHVIQVGTDTSTGGATATTATSLTVVVTECQAEFITWFLSYASLKYTLESYQDYLHDTPVKDPACPSVTSAQGVTLQLVQKAFPTLF